MRLDEAEKYDAAALRAAADSSSSQAGTGFVSPRPAYTRGAAVGTPAIHHRKSEHGFALLATTVSREPTLFLVGIGAIAEAIDAQVFTDHAITPTTRSAGP